MSSMNRRQFVKLAGGAVLAVGALPTIGHGKTKARVIVIGGGYGGGTAAKYLRLYDPSLQVTLIEKNKEYISCPLSNEVLAGDRNLDSLTFGYGGLKGHGVDVIHDEVTEIDPEKKTVATGGGRQLEYDFVVVSPGVGYRWGAIEGYNPSAVEAMPHAWEAGEQTLRLRRQIRAMEDGGTVFIVAPPNPFRCPPGPYERAAQISHYLKANKPKSKVIILDPKYAFSKQKLFQQGWEMHYPGMIEWVGGHQDGKVIEVDPKRKLLVTEFEEHKAAVANVIPPQKAGPIAEKTGLTDDSGWCPVDPRSFESTIHSDVHVIGDSCIAGAMPKSGYAANSQAKVLAAAIAAKASGKRLPEPSYVNTCYSLITPDHGISVAAVYSIQDGEISGVEGAGGLSPLEASAEQRKEEALYAHSWYRNVTADIFT